MSNGVRQTLYIEDNCTLFGNISIECYRNMLGFVSSVNNEVWTQYKNSRENRVGADMYTISILGIFASVIVCLLFRSISKTENVDDQVALLLSSMQIHVDYEERQRQRKKMREDKSRAKAWLSEVRFRSLRKLRGRSSSVHGAVKERSSVCSVPTPLRYSPLPLKPSSRAISYQGYLPEIVVTDHNYHQPPALPASRTPSVLSRQSSGYSCKSATFSFDREPNEDIFVFPDPIQEFP